MRIRVDLPAPFSPIRACTSPGRASNETSSFATTPGKRFVMPSSTTKGGALARPAPSPSLIVVGRRRCRLRILRNLDRPVDDVLPVQLERRDDVRSHQLAVGFGVVQSLVRQVEDLSAALERAVAGLLDRVVDGRV